MANSVNVFADSRSPRVIAMAAVAIASALLTPAAAQRMHTITMDGTRFVPKTITVARGDHVVWVNEDPFPHTATAAGKFDSKNIAEGGSWAFTAEQAGEFAYVCTLHPGMTGVLVVK